MAKQVADIVPLEKNLDVPIAGVRATGAHPFAQSDGMRFTRRPSVHSW